MHYMALGKQLPIRLETDVEQRLEAAAQKNGTTKSALIRLLAKTFVDQVVKADGGISLPPQWSSLLPKADERAAKKVRERPHKTIHRLNCDGLNDASSSETLPPKQEVKYPKPAKKKRT